MIDRDTAQRIKDTANIVDVVGDYVHLVRRGANYMGLCPFHNERTPSFSVSPKKNYCKCFSCGKGGGPVNFLMEKEGITYNEALLRLARKYNIHVEERELTDEERQRISEREAMMVASEWTMNYFHDNLYNTEEGRDIGLSYLYGRGITDEAIRRYRLGYSIDRGNDLLKKARGAGFDIEVFKKIGLIGQSQEGREYDKFRGRVIFPIRNSSGKPIAFGGRALKGEPAKYINSPESPIYHKSNELYGLFEAKNEVMKKDRVFLMEGYLDVIGSSQAGLQNAVASSGTSLTDGQIALLHRFTSNVTLIYDGDSAGIKASLRGIDMLLSQQLHVSVLLLPQGEDPDSFARKVSPEEFQRYIAENSSDFIEFKSKVLLQDAGNDVQARSRAVESVVASIACIPSEIERTVYIQKCSSLMGVDEAVVTRQVNHAIFARSAPKGPTPTYPPVSGHQPAAPESPVTTVSAPASPYIKHEEEIIKYCVRYAYLPFDDATEGQDPVAMQTVVEYIAEELEADGIGISEPEFHRVITVLLANVETYRQAYTRREKEVDSRLRDLAAEFFNQLARAGGTMDSIKRAEQEFLERQGLEKSEEMRNFATQYSIAFLLDHEDDAVRRVATPLAEDRHRLSAIYQQEGHHTVSEEERLPILVDRALTELRYQILNQQIKELKLKLSDPAVASDSQAQLSVMQDLARLMQVRQAFAENLGERIISPR